jgi:hypothetical protein
LHKLPRDQKSEVDRLSKFCYPNPALNRARERLISVRDALDRRRALIRADARALRFSRPLLPIQVLDCRIGSGKMRDLQLSRAKELDSANRLSANFQRGAT